MKLQFEKKHTAVGAGWGGGGGNGKSKPKGYFNVGINTTRFLHYYYTAVSQLGISLPAASSVMALI